MEHILSSHFLLTLTSYGCFVAVGALFVVGGFILAAHRLEVATETIQGIAILRKWREEDKVEILQNTRQHYNRQLRDLGHTCLIYVAMVTGIHLIILLINVLK